MGGKIRAAMHTMLYLTRRRYETDETLRYICQLQVCLQCTHRLALEFFFSKRKIRRCLSINFPQSSLVHSFSSGLHLRLWPTCLFLDIDSDPSSWIPTVASIFCNFPPHINRQRCEFAEQNHLAHPCLIQWTNTLTFPFCDLRHNSSG